MAGRVLALGCLLVFLLASQRVESQTEFVCYASTDCYGAAVSSLPQKGECCAGRGLSFQLDGLSDCQNCFTEESFTANGSEFYLAFFNNLDFVSFLTRASLSVRVSNLEERAQTVRVSFGTKDEEKEIGPGKSKDYYLPVALRLENIGETGKGVVVRSMNGAGLSVTAFGDELTSSDTYHVLPCVYLPSVYEYYAVSVAVQNITLVVDDEEIVLDPLGNSVFVVVASEDNTQLTVTPTQSVSIISPDDETLPGTSKTVTLNKRETLFVSSVEDLTGSHVLSDKPVAFFSGHECGTIPATVSFCDQMVEQIPPTSTWGKEFYTVSLMMRERDGYKAISSRDGNTLRRTCNNVSSNNVEVTSLDLPPAGKAIDFDIPMDQFCRFESNFPVLLVQFSLGGGSDGNIFADPFMAIVPPVEQYRNSYRLDYFRSSSPRIVNYLNIILVNSTGIDRSDVQLGGESIDRDIWTDIRCSEESVETCAYGVQVSNLGTGTVSLTHPDPNAQLLGITYALAYRTGQGSFSGMTQKPIALDTVTLDRSEYSAEEGNRVVGITLYRTGDMLDSITVPFRVQAILGAENAAIPDEDFMEMEMDIRFPPQKESVIVEVELSEDDIFPEDDKVFEVYIGASPGAFVSPNAHVNVTILNDDPPLPVMNISFSGMFHSVMEGGGFLELTLIKTEGAVGPVTVSLFTAAKSATDFEDFAPLEVNITFEAAVTERTVQIVILNDNVVESVEQFSVTIVAVEGLFPVEVIDAVAVVEITDNDGNVEVQGNLSFTIISLMSDGLVQFTLTCISTGGTTTIVSWTRDSQKIAGETTSVLDDAETTQYTHTLTATGSIDSPTTYQCTVSNNKPSEDTANFTVQGSPDNLVLIGKEDEEYGSQDEEYATVEVSWDAVMLGENTSDVSYHLSYFTVEDNDLIFQLSKVLPANTTSTTVAVRDSFAGLEHLFTVKSVLKMESIVYESESVNASIVFDKAYLQLQFGTVDHCITWAREKAEAIEKKLRFQIKEAIFKRCRDCRKLSKSLLRRGVFLCQSQPTMATYRSSLVSPGLPGLANASSLVRHVQQWVDTAPVVRLDWLLVRINQDCPVALRQLSDPECSTPANDPQVINTIHSVLNACAVRNLGSQICQNTSLRG